MGSEDGDAVVADGDVERRGTAAAAPWAAGGAGATARLPPKRLYTRCMPSENWQ
jgi:hypothetical protein